jgi:hypothetical protein
MKGDAVYIADPNFPGDGNRSITFADGKFQPYRSGATEYIETLYIGGWALVANNIGERWREFEKKTIGNDRFPGYSLQVREGPDRAWADLEVGFRAEQDKIAVRAQRNGGGEPLYASVFKNGSRLLTDDAGFVTLEDGGNELGVLVTAKVDGRAKYVDFHYVDVYFEKGPELTTDRMYFDTGELEAEWDYYIGGDGEQVMHGYKITYFRDGSISMKDHYVDGELDGVQESYWPDGTIMWRYEMKMGVKDGYSREYYSDGSLYQEILYVDGVPVSGSGYTNW